MKTINVRKDELLEVLRRNRDNHRALFEEAVANWNQKWLEVLAEQTEKVLKGRRFQSSISLPTPEDHTSDYDRVIKMLEMSTDDIIGLDEDDAAMYVMDQWQWKRAFVANTVSYTAAAPNYQ